MKQVTLYVEGQKTQAAGVISASLETDGKQRKVSEIPVLILSKEDYADALDKMYHGTKIEFVKTGVQLFMHTCYAIIKTYISDRTGDKMYNILVVDDERIHREGLIMLLEKICPDDMLWEASNGQEAMEIMNNISCEIVISDIRMAEMDGLQLQKK